MRAIDEQKGHAGGIEIPAEIIDLIDRGEDPDSFAVAQVDAANSELEAQQTKSSQLEELAEKIEASMATSAP